MGSDEIELTNKGAKEADIGGKWLVNNWFNVGGWVGDGGSSACRFDGVTKEVNLLACEFTFLDGELDVVVATGLEDSLDVLEVFFQGVGVDE